MSFHSYLRMLMIIKDIHRFYYRQWFRDSSTHTRRYANMRHLALVAKMWGELTVYFL